MRAPNRFFTGEFDLLFDELFNTDWEKILAWPVVSQLPRTLASEFPPCDLEVDENKNLTYSFAIAGYEEEDVTLTYEDEHLILSLKGKESEKDKKFVQKRIKRGEVKASYYVPMAKYDASGITSSLKNGILEVRIPVREDAKPVKITINK